MPDNTIQASFNSGEWSPYLYSRVDMAKYRSGATLLRNFFVDYRGGATARAGTEHIFQCYKSATTVRIIPFQASQNVGYVLEFGELYVRFFNNGAPVLSTAIALTSISAANPAVVTSAAPHGLSTNDWVYITGVATQSPSLNGQYYIFTSTGASTGTLSDLQGNVISTAGAGVGTGGTMAEVYTVVSPYAATELALLKFTQNVNTMIICHPNHPQYELILNSAADWDLQAITFGSTVTTPTGASGGATGAVGGAGTVNYAYVVTAVDSSGQESAPTAPIAISNRLDIRSVVGSLSVAWSAVAGATSYNVYRAEISYTVAVPAGAAYGYVGNTTGTTFIDSNIVPDFSVGFPQVMDPFSGTGVQTIALTSGGADYDAVPAMSFTASPGIDAVAYATVGMASVGVLAAGARYNVGDVLGVSGASGGASVIVNTVGLGGVVTGISILNTGLITGAGNPVPGLSQNTYIISTADPFATGLFISITWKVVAIALSNPGTGYGVTPTITFTGGTPSAAATATATLGAPSSGNPTVPIIYQQRLVFAGPVASPQQFNASQSGAYYNFNVTFPTLPSDAFQGTLASGQLNNIQSMIAQPQGLIVFSDRQAWLINGGSPGAGIDATNTVANAHIFNGAGTPPPIVAVDDILYVQAKNSIVRDLIFDFSKQVYTGRDISVLSSHLFYGFQILEWCFAEEPFKLIWAVRSDGQLLCLTFLKEQELCAWAHSDTSGAFNSCASVVEDSIIGEVDAAYFVVQRVVNTQTLQFIERMTELYYPSGLTDAWCVDAGLQFNGTATLSFAGAQHLGGLSCTGLATDDTGNVTIIPTFTMAANGAFTLAAPASPATGYTRVTVGTPYTAQLKTLPLELGDPTIQGKVKKINSVDVRVANALGLDIGQDFDHLTPMKDLVLGNVSSTLTGQQSQLVTGLVNGDARTFLSPAYTVPGQYCIEQSKPYPATILGVIPNITLGDPGSKS